MKDKVKTFRHLSLIIVFFAVSFASCAVRRQVRDIEVEQNTIAVKQYILHYDSKRHSWRKVKYYRNGSLVCLVRPSGIAWAH